MSDMIGDAVVVYVVTADALEAMGHQEDVRCQMTDAEVLTTAFMSALHFGGHIEKASDFLKSTGLIPGMLSPSNTVEATPLRNDNKRNDSWPSCRRSSLETQLQSVFQWQAMIYCASATKNLGLSGPSRLHFSLHPAQKSGNVDHRYFGHMRGSRSLSTCVMVCIKAKRIVIFPSVECLSATHTGKLRSSDVNGITKGSSGTNAG